MHLLSKQAGQVIYENMKREKQIRQIKDEGRDDHGHSQQIKLNNFTVSLWDKRNEIPHLISTATEMTRFAYKIVSDTNSVKL